MSELVDLVDDSGVVVYEKIAREKVDRYPDARMQVIIAVIFNSLGGVLVHERAPGKDHGGKVDFVCGGVQNGQTPLDAAKAEADQETGVVPDDLKVIRQGVNEYGRYCFLLLGHSDEQPKEEGLNREEVSWASFMPVGELYAKAESGELIFVDGFFEDLEFASAQDNEAVVHE